MQNWYSALSRNVWENKTTKNKHFLYLEQIFVVPIAYGWTSKDKSEASNIFLSFFYNTI